MGEILGIGCSHGPGITGPLTRLTDIYLRRNLQSELTPVHMKDPKNWPKKMQEEWDGDEGLAFAAAYQRILQPAYRKARECIDEFKPDFVLIFGDDQYEVFKEDCIPPFAVLAIDNVQIKDSPHSKDASASIKGSKQIGNYLVHGLVTKGFDVACCWRLRNQENYGHAFTTTLQYLDLDKRGFDYPIIPVTVNCYGSNLRVPNDQYPVTKMIGRLLENVAEPPPPSPPPWRCYDLGKAVAEIIKQSPWRAVVIGSSSWSHASLTTKNYYLWPDVETDRQRFAELKSGEHRKWRSLDAELIRDAGQHEFLNWICLAGAMDDRRAEILAWAECYIFNSSKCVCLFRPT